MKKPIDYTLKEKISDHQHGDELAFAFMQITAPNGDVRNEYFQLKRHWQEAKNEFAMRLAKLMPDQLKEAQENAEEAKQSKPEEVEEEKPESIEDTINGVIEVFNIANIDTNPMLDALESILLKQGKWNNEYMVKRGHFRKISLEDQENLLNFYIANFL
jgi:hypothetical protein